MSRFDLVKDERFSFKKDENLNSLSVILGWQKGADLDACAFLVGQSGVIENDANFVFFNSENRTEPFDRLKFGNKSAWRANTRPMSADGSVLGAHDERDGGGNEEVINVDLSKVAADVDEILFCATIYDKDKTFGDVVGPYVSVVNDDNGEELCRYTLNEDFAGVTAVVAASLTINEDGEWCFNAQGKGLMGGMPELVDIYAN